MKSTIYKQIICICLSPAMKQLLKKPVFFGKSL